MANPKRGEIWMVDFNPARGSEQAGKRPALIIQNEKNFKPGTKGEFRA
jgi:mRNA-degrading endonuclease toxin of MazEF toxin-antitoxin module